MGSQTLEILRQGVWASLTGGWFYDPHQNVFCNSVHLYLWLFLLCSPFVTYLYFPKTLTTWGIYCILTGVTVAVVKIINLALHVMYDEAQIVSDNHLKQTIKSLRETPGDDDGGIEMQVLGGATALSGTSCENNISNDISHANSALSFDFPEQGASTIDLKVDVHRKNSSESSDISKTSLKNRNIVNMSTVTTQSAEVCQTINYRRTFTTKSKSEEDSTLDLRRGPISDLDERSRILRAIDQVSKVMDLDGIRRNNIPNSRRLRSRLQRQISLDSEQIGMGSIFSGETGLSAMLHRFCSTDSNSDGHYHRRRHGQNFGASNSIQQSVPSDLLYYIPDDEDAYLTQQKTPMRKDSNSTMSALQLPTGSVMPSSSRVRRHSNTTGKAGGSMMSSSVRRIKSAALETCCPQPSVSNLSPHPNSVETINGGQTLRNPQHSMLPPPSKSLVRNQHLNLFHKGNGNNSTGISNGNSTSNNINSGLSSTKSNSDPVYPIAELADERSLHEAFIFDSQESDDSDDDEDEDDDDDEDEDEEDDDDDEEDNAVKQSNNCTEHNSSTSDSDLERPRTQSTDSDTENNGSRSPLLDLKSRSAYFVNKSGDKKDSTQQTDKFKQGMASSTSTLSTTMTGGTGNGDGSSSASGAPAQALSVTTPLSIANNQITKSEDSGCPSSDCDQASASSKDMLLTSTTTTTTTSTTIKDITALADRLWFDFSMDSNNISVDVTDPGEGSSKMAVANELKNRKNLGAIPKTTSSNPMKKSQKSARYDQSYDDIEEALPKSLETDLQQVSSSRASSWSTFSGGSAGAGAIGGVSLEYDRPPVDVLHSTKDGWVVKSSSTNPALASARGDPPPLIPIYNAQRPYICFHPPNQRHPTPKLRHLSARSRLQNASFDTTASNSRDEENLTRSACAWDCETEGDVRDPINSGLLLPFDVTRQMPERMPPDSCTVTSTSGGGTNALPISIGGVEFSDTLFCDYWHYTLPPEKQIQPKRYYKYPFRCFGYKHEIKISMDRLQLMALLDRDLGWFPAILAIVLAAMVSMLGAVVLRLGIYKDLMAFLFCFVIAGSQYSLLKSVQPDAASPVHGFNKTVAYSRPIYFCLCSAILILANHLAHVNGDHSNTLKTLTLFAMPFNPNDFFQVIENIMSFVLLLLPIFFSLGLFPQINTYLMYIIEQIDMHVFGGSAVCSLLAAFLGLLRSLLACSILYGPVFGGLTEPRGSQHILFSCFCALLMAVSYHLSRSASDITCIWALIKSSLVMHPDDDDDDKEKSQTDETDIHEDADDSQKSKKIDEAISEQPQKPLTEDSQRIATATTITTQLSACNESKDNELEDPLPKKLQSTVNARLKNDLVVCFVIVILTLSLHCSTVFTVLQPEINSILYTAAVALGFLLHYVVPQMRKHLPWLCFANPILKQNEFGKFEPHEAAQVMWFESTYVFLCFFERNILYPLVFLSALTADSMVVAHKFGIPLGAAIVSICGLKCIRSSYSDPSSQYLILLFAVLFFRLDYVSASETFLIDFFVVAIVYKKFCEFLLKLQFIITYIAPWQITWGSAFHAFAQPFSIPHSAMLFLQAAVSAVLSTPLNPFLGSAIFLTSYVRPIKFWERDYNTRRIDHSNTRLSSQLERDLGADDNNLNSIFYEHLTRSLQHSLCGDLLMGRWGNVSQGDCFVLASDYLNCLVHIIELGNGLCTFQMRGLEFRGTYCQQREVEAISEGVEENDGCCCCSPGHLPNMLSVNAMFSTRWLAWQVVASKYVLEGYSISDNLAQATLQVFEFRKVLITYYVKSIIYYTIRSPKLQEWLQSPAIQESLRSTLDRSFVDLDPIFNHNLDEDFDFRASGITRHSFCGVYMNWIQFCWSKRYQSQQNVDATASPDNAGTTTSSANESKRTTPRSSSNPTPSPRDTGAKSLNSQNSKPQPQHDDVQTETEEREDMIVTRESSLISLLLALGILARRTLATASHNNSLVTVVELFLHGLHALFKGDFRITSPRDEWVFADMDLLHSVVAPAVKMALKLHQDHFLSPDEYDDSATLYDAIDTHTKELVISHEADPLWRNAVLRGAPNLLALRHVMEDGSDEYRLIRLTKRFLSFRVIKLNRECVRGLWAGQQQELIYLRNRNPERGSIQNAKQALRNIINSSCDQPIGYPIYVSPLTTSYAETNEQLCNIVGGAITLEKLHKLVVGVCQRVRKRCREGCSSGSATLDTEMGEMQGVYCNAPTPNNTLSGTTGTLSYGSQSLSGAGNRGSLASMGKPTNSTLFAGLLNREREREREPERESVRERGVKRRNSVITKSDRERRATLPASATAVSGSSIDATMNKESLMGGSSINEFKQQNSADSYLAATTSGCYNTHLKPNSSFSSGNLGARNTKNLLISADRKSKSEERHTSRERDDLDDTLPLPRIGLNKKVIIVDSGEIYDCLDLGRRIDVDWPNEIMRSSGGRSSWKEWTPQEGMVGFIVHYWQPNHPDSQFRSNFNRTLFLIQIGDRYVPVGENGVKEYNTIGVDERIKIVHIPKDELKLVESEGNDIPEERSEESEEYVLSIDNCV